MGNYILPTRLLLKAHSEIVHMGVFSSKYNLGLDIDFDMKSLENIPNSFIYQKYTHFHVN
jgi:hypothetical protein